MTETSPVASVGHIKSDPRPTGLDDDARPTSAPPIGLPLVGVDARIVDPR